MVPAINQAGGHPDIHSGEVFAEMHARASRLTQDPERNSVPEKSESPCFEICDGAKARHAEPAYFDYDYLNPTDS